MSLNRATTWEPRGWDGRNRRTFVDGHRKDMDPFGEKIVTHGFDISCVGSRGGFEFAIFPKGEGLIEPVSEWKLHVVHGEASSDDDQVLLPRQNEDEKIVRNFMNSLRKMIKKRNEENKRKTGKKNPDKLSIRELQEFLDRLFVKYSNVKGKKIK